MASIRHFQTGRRDVAANEIPWDGPQVDRAFPLTDAGNAEHFAACYGDELRYDWRRGRWLYWDAHHWTPDHVGMVYRLALESIRRRQASALTLTHEETRKAALSHALKSENRNRLDALLAIARALRPVSDDGSHWDRDPWLLGCPNGVVDLRTGLLRDGRPDDYITMSTGVPFDADAVCRRWDRFVAEVFEYPDLIDFVWRAIGYSLCGETSMQVIFLKYGTGANGKGTFSNTLRSVLGDYAWNMPFSTIELQQRGTIPNDLAALVGRRFVIASETNDGTRLNEARIKSLTGSDPITARFLHGEFFEFEPTAKFWLAFNHKPIVRDDSHGFWRRIRLIPFTRTFPVDETLRETLASEGPGILAWAVRGCLAWQQRGLEAPACVLEATAEYQADSDHLGAFLQAACALDANASTRASDLFEHYKLWANREGLSDRERLSATAFGRKMSERFEKTKSATGKRYQGIETVSWQ